MMTAQQRTLAASLTRRAITHERKAAQTAHALWPTDDDQLHSKVERVQQALTRLGKKETARQIGTAHGAAWRKQKRLLIQEHGRKPLPYKDGDVTQADWRGYAEDAEDAALMVCQLAGQVIRLAERTGPTTTTLGLIDAAYWAAKEADDELWCAQGAIPPCDDALRLFVKVERRANLLQQQKDELVTLADSLGHTITR